MSSPIHNAFQVDDIRALSPAPQVHVDEFSEDRLVPLASSSPKVGEKGRKPAEPSRPRSSSLSSQTQLDSQAPGAPPVTPSTPQTGSRKEAQKGRKMAASPRSGSGSFTKSKDSGQLSATRRPSNAAPADAGIIQVTPSRELSFGVAEQQLESGPDDWVGGGAGAGTTGAVRAASPDIKKRIQRSASASASAAGSASAAALHSKKSDISPSRVGSPLRMKHSKSANQVSNHFFQAISKKTQDALTYINLTKGYTRGEARMESQALRIALANATIPGEKLVMMAARKIQAWWFLMGPRQLLKRRMRNWRMCKDMVVDIVNASIMVTLKKKRQRAHMLRNGATLTITRLIKCWFYVTRKREAPVGGWRQGAHHGLSTVRVQSSGSNLAHKESRKQPAAEQNVVLVGSGGAGSGGGQGKHADAHRHGHGHHRDKKKRRWNKLLVAYVLQGFAKIIAAKKLVREMRRKLKEEKKKPKKKKISTYTFKKAATIIQSFFRSSQARTRLLKIIKASLVVNKAYRQHRAFKRLRGDLRRVERPCRIKIHGVRNLPEQIFTKGQGGIAVRVSCYWSGLLHIFSSLTELKSVLRGKKPQWSLTTEFHPVAKQLSEKELETEMHAVEAKEAVGVKKGILSRLSRVGSLIGGKQTLGQRKSVVDFQHRNLQRLKALQALKSVEESESESGSEDEDEDEDEDSKESQGGGSDVYKPSRFQSYRKKENRTLDRSDTDVDMGRQKYCSAFQDEYLRVPCIHGNSVLKFEFLLNDGTVFAESSYFCSEKKGLMFWGGEETATLNYKSLSKPLPSVNGMRDTRRNEIITPEFDLMAVPPSLEFTVTCGVPMMSRVGYSKVKLSSNGPMMNSMYSKFGFFHFFLNTWKKYFLSLDGEGLSFFDTKHCATPFHIIPVSEITFVAVMQGKPTSAAQAPFEDTHDVILRTVHHETIYLRLSDVGNRVFWHEVLVSCVKGVPAFTLMRSDSVDSETDKNSTSADSSATGYLGNITVLGAVGGVANFTHDAVRGSANLVGDGFKNVVGTILPGAFIPGFLKSREEEMAQAPKSKRTRSNFVANEIYGKINNTGDIPLSRVSSDLTEDTPGRGSKSLRGVSSRLDSSIGEDSD